MTKAQLTRKFRELQETSRNIERELFESIICCMDEETLGNRMLPRLITHRTAELLAGYWRNFIPNKYDGIIKYINEKTNVNDILT